MTRIRGGEDKRKRKNKRGVVMVVKNEKGDKRKNKDI